jgi:hypothetical protein
MKKIFITGFITLAFVLAGCSSPLEGVGVKPAIPATPVLTAGNGTLTVTWNGSNSADSYNVYYGTSETCPAHPVLTGITGTSAVITGLSNGSTYYVWVQAVNRRGDSISGMAQKTLILEAPATVSVTVRNGNLTVNWTASSLADSYSVYYGTSQTPPAQPVQTGITGTSTVITGVTNETTYYVWVQAVNNGGPSSLSAPADSIHDFIVTSGAELNAAVNAINASNTGGAYTITVENSFLASPVIITGAIKTVTIKGAGSTHAVSNGGSSRLFTVGANIHLILDNNIILNGNSKADPLVYVYGSLTMKAGSTISGAGGSGVYIDGGSFTMLGGTIGGNTSSGVHISTGSFVMSGGTISGNTGSSFPRRAGGVYIGEGSFTLSGGTISGNTAEWGGGVYIGRGRFIMSGGTVSGNTVYYYDWYSIGHYGDGGGVYIAGGSFTLSGGTVSGNTAEWGGGVFVGSGGSLIKSGGGTIDATNSASAGKVTYVVTGNKRRETTAGPAVNLDSNVTGPAGGWE